MTPNSSNGLRAAVEALGGSLSSQTVMSPNRDPFRLDVPAKRRDAEWLRDTWDRLDIKKKIHVAVVIPLGDLGLGCHRVPVPTVRSYVSVCPATSTTICASAPSAPRYAARVLISMSS